MSTKPIEIFRAGTHTATNGTVLDVSVADLADIVAVYDPAKHEAPLVIGHPKMDHPAYGWVAGLRVEGDLLVADAHQLDAAFADAVDAKRYKKVSASFFLPGGKGNPTPGKLHLKHVGFLGAVPPAVKGLRQVSFADGDEGTVEFSDWGDRAAARLFRQLREWLIGKFGVEEADKALNSWDLDTVAEAAVTPAPASFADPTPSPEEVARLAEIARREAELDRRTAEFAERDREARLADHGTFLDKLIGEGRVLPKEREDLLSFMSTLDEAGTVSFADGADKPAGDVFRAFAAVVGPRVPMGEIATGETVDFADEKSITKAADAMVTAAAERGDTLTFAQAVSQLNKGVVP
ncbi:hypothetical protein [Niveispirillum sp. KHB5.9]|uniref:hypothetical protein n=1 Tax=Niveispirillum sp. KHB5.9 TaxID=3400269 RepID=UPI003A8C37CF